MVEKQQYSQAEIDFDEAYLRILDDIQNDYPDATALRDAFIYAKKAITGKILCLNIAISDFLQIPTERHYHVVNSDSNKKILLDAINGVTESLYGRSLIDSIVVTLSFLESHEVIDYANCLESGIPTCSKGRESEFLEWNGHYFRSPQELAIAKELDDRNLLFFPNAGCRINEGIQRTREIDFLVCVNGNWGILECDSDTYHTSAAKDHKRDEVFNRNGIWFIRRFTSEDCKNPKAVVNTFLELMDQFYSRK